MSYAKVHRIFRESCGHCHNADKEKGGLRLDSYESLVAGGESGNPIVAGQSGKSLLVQMVEGSVEPRMPYEEDPLPPDQIALLRKWVDAGAPGPAPGASPADEEIPLPDVRPTVRSTGAVTAVAFDAVSRRVAVGGYQTLHLMAVADRKWVAALGGHADLIRAVVFSADGKWLAAAGGPSGRFGEVRIWNVEGPEARLVSTLRGHTDAILGVAFSPDAKTIATASYDRLVKLWDVASGRETRTLKEHSDAVYDVTFTSDGRHVVSGAGDRTVKVWDAASGRRLATLGDSLDAVYTVAVHPSGGEIAAGGADRMIRAWTWRSDAAGPVPATPVLRASTFAHGDAVLRVAYSADGATLASAGADRAIKVWDARTLRETALLEPQPDWAMALALSRDGRWLAAGRYDGTLGLYDLANGRSGEQFVVPEAPAARARREAAERERAGVGPRER